MLLLIAFVLCTEVEFIEMPQHNISYNPGAESDITLKSGNRTGEGILMKTSSEKGAIVQFNKRNEVDEWSFAFTINKPELSPPQLIGTYLWYTADKVKEGRYKGVSSDFNGFAAGVEFLGMGVELVILHNDGRKDATPEQMVVLRDSVDHERLKNVDLLTVKVISTTKNFRIELYDNDRLLYDNLRFKDASVLGTTKSGNYFSISSWYEKTAHKEKIILKSSQLFTRKEHDGYDPLAVRSAPVEKKPRFHDEINHSNKDTRHLISALEHYIYYFRSLIGQPAGTPIVNAVNDIRREVEAQLKKVKKINEGVATMPTEEHAEIFNELEMRIKNVERKMEGMKIGINDVLEMLEEMQGRSGFRSKMVLTGMVAATIGITAAMCYGIFKEGIGNK